MSSVVTVSNDPGAKGQALALQRHEPIVPALHPRLLRAAPHPPPHGRQQRRRRRQRPGGPSRLIGRQADVDGEAMGGVHADRVRLVRVCKGPHRVAVLDHLVRLPHRRGNAERRNAVVLGVPRHAAVGEARPCESEEGRRHRSSARATRGSTPCRTQRYHGERGVRHPPAPPRPRRQRRRRRHVVEDAPCVQVRVHGDTVAIGQAVYHARHPAL